MVPSNLWFYTNPQKAETHHNWTSCHLLHHHIAPGSMTSFLGWWLLWIVTPHGRWGNGWKHHPCRPCCPTYKQTKTGVLTKHAVIAWESCVSRTYGMESVSEMADTSFLIDSIWSERWWFPSVIPLGGSSSVCCQHRGVVRHQVNRHTMPSDARTRVALVAEKS